MASYCHLNLSVTVVSKIKDSHSKERYPQSKQNALPSHHPTYKNTRVVDNKSLSFKKILRILSQF